MNMLVLIMVLISRPITPPFTANWLRIHGGNPEWVRRTHWVSYLALGSVVLLALSDMWAPAPVIGAIALLAGLSNGVRLFLWSGWRAAREPLLWLLLLGYLLRVIVLLLRSAAAFNPGV